MSAAPDPVRARFETHLREQLEFLERSASLFDRGHETEAKRLATTLRVLFHDTSNSTSLMNHLGMLTTKVFTTPVTRLDDWRDYLDTTIDLQSAKPVKFIPKLGNIFQEIPLSSWWSSEAIGVDTRVSRRRIVLAAANKDGGAHIDSVLQPFYEAIRAGAYGLGLTGSLTYDGPPPFSQGVTIFPDNAHLAFIRQFSHETIQAARHFGWVTS